MPSIGQLVPEPIPPLGEYYGPQNWGDLPSYSLYTVDHLVFPYLLYDLDIEYVWDNGQLQAPVSPSVEFDPEASPDQTPFLLRPETPTIQVSAPYGKKIVRFHVVRRGVQPYLPYPWSTDPNEVLLYSSVRPKAPVTSEDGMSLIYEVEGIYLYNLLQPYWPTDGYTGGATGVSYTLPVDNLIPVDNFTTAFSNLDPQASTSIDQNLYRPNSRFSWQVRTPAIPGMRSH